MWSSPTWVFCKKVVQNSQEEICAAVSFLTEFQAFSLRLKKIWSRLFNKTPTKFLKTHFHRTPPSDCYQATATKRQSLLRKYLVQLSINYKKLLKLSTMFWEYLKRSASLAELLAKSSFIKTELFHKWLGWTAWRTHILQRNFWYWNIESNVHMR